MRLVLLFSLMAAVSAPVQPAVGPSKGTLIIAGGAALGPEIIQEFIDRAGGPDAPVVVIPTADSADSFDSSWLDRTLLHKAGLRNLIVLHTRDRRVADSESFVAPLRKVRAVWFPGGRQWRLADAYLNTRTERELRALLDRGGVIGGTSAGATIQGGYLVRGAVEGPQIVMSPGHEEGFGFLRGVAIDQHLVARHRENDLLAVIAKYPALLGIGIDEGTAIVVQGDIFRVIGKSKVAIYDRNYKAAPDGKPYYFLAAGDRFDLRRRRPLPALAPANGAADAKAFLDGVESRLLNLQVEANRAGWVRSTFITYDTEILASKADERAIAATVEAAKKSTRFDRLKLPAELERKLKLLKLSLTVATPADPAEAEELTRTIASMEGMYGKGKYCPPGKDHCLDLEELSKILANSRDPNELLDAWRGWHHIAPPIKKPFERYVELANKGARQLGFADTGAMWRSKYDLPPEAFSRELDRLWEQVKPLYLALHAYVRWKLREKYGERIVPAAGPIPAHLLGNMWAQQWDNIYPLVAPQGADPGIDLTEILKRRNTDQKQMVRYGEHFFTSLGFAPLPQTFWERSLLARPRDREVVCHASAWDVDAVEDLRIKACLDITGEDFLVVHHELGHNFYQRAYARQPYLFRDSANDGFHEAVGDTIALSVTPEYLVKIGLLDRAPDASKDIGLLLRRALEKIAFLPFGLLIDQWRWKVFSGEITPDRYNQTWWELRRKYQGVEAPIPRSEADFDPGAKYHVPANFPYARYFLADILQFQFHRALARAAGCSGPLHRCSIYGSQAAGQRLNAMLAMGQSRPWPEALEAIAGQKQMDATAMRDYFAPLEKWLAEQNRGKPVGW